jgi:formate dehydrogenase maturation protein FdhE
MIRLCLRHSMCSALKLCQQHGLPPFAADSLIREDAWQAYLDALLQRYQPAEQPAVKTRDDIAGR